MDQYRIEIKWALIFTVMMLAWIALERMVGLHDQYIARHALYTNLVAIPAFLIYCLALRDKRDNFYGGTMTYSQGFVSGAIVSVIIALLSPLTQYVIHTLITPDYFANAITYAVASDNMTEFNARNYFNLSNYLIQSAVSSLILGLMTTAVVALFLRKHPSEVIGESD